MKKLLFLSCILLCIVLRSHSQQVGSLNFYAYGENNQIEVYWDYLSPYYTEPLLGCNVFRADSIDGTLTMVNSNLITDPLQEFYFLDTVNVVDSIAYYYRIEFVYQNNAICGENGCIAMKWLGFETVDEENLRIYMVPRNGHNLKTYLYGSTTPFLYQVMPYFVDNTDTVVFTMNTYFMWTFYDGLFFETYFDDTGAGLEPIIYALFGTDYLRSLTIVNFLPNTVEKEFSVYPNPVTDHLSISLFSEKTQEIQCRLFSITGNCIYSFPEKTVVKGENTIRFIIPGDIRNNNSSMHILHLRGETIDHRLKVLFTNISDF